MRPSPPPRTSLSSATGEEDTATSTNTIVSIVYYYFYNNNNYYTLTLLPPLLCTKPATTTITILLPLLILLYYCYHYHHHCRDGTDIFAINALHFHGLNTFVTAGSDGVRTILRSIVVCFTCCHLYLQFCIYSTSLPSSTMYVLTHPLTLYTHTVLHLHTYTLYRYPHRC